MLTKFKAMVQLNKMIGYFGYNKTYNLFLMGDLPLELNGCEIILDEVKKHIDVVETK